MEVECDDLVIDVDTVFMETNRNFTLLLDRMGLSIDFDFSNRNNKRLYTHEFIKTFCELLKLKTHLNIVFFSNNLTKDKFRNQLLSKIERIFKVKIWKENYDYDEFCRRVRIKDAKILSGLELAFQPRKPPSFKKISKYLEKEGLTFLNETYFQNVVNKMVIFNH
jgi:hypothetical protein